jgi:hypothetical protein
MSSSYLESSHNNVFSDSIDGLKQHTYWSTSHHPDDTVIQTGKSGSQ